MNGWEEYMKSEAWFALKKEALARAGYRCECKSDTGRCSSITHLEMHHDRYPQFFPSGDNVRNVRILCRDCHETFHSVAKEHGWFVGYDISTDVIEMRAHWSSLGCCHDATEIDISSLVEAKEIPALENARDASP